MVGVPGKSTGCATCRRRRIKCDGTKPVCLRCAKGVRVCEGYDRFPTFINRTQHGLTKRAPLEEAKPSSSITLSSFSSPGVESARLIAWFWESFMRFPPSRYALQSSSHWLDHFVGCYPAYVALQSSLLAVATMRLGKATRRPDVLSEGRRLYTESLALTRKALMCEHDIKRDELVATTCVMILYELFDSTAESLQGWLNHLRGLSRLIECRGPEMHARPAAHAVFEHGRYVLMLQHLLARRGSVFSRRDWLEEPWRGQQKSIEQQVFDQGLRAAAIFEQCDNALHTILEWQEYIDLLQDCVDVQDTLVKLRQEHIDPIMNEEKAPQLLSITSLGISLGVCESTYSLAQLAHEQPCTVLATNDDDPTALQGIQAKVRCLGTCRRPLADRIVREIKTCLDAPPGAMGAARMIFSLRLAVQQIPPDDACFDLCQTMMNQLSGQTSKFSPFTQADPSLVVMSGETLVQDNANQIARRWVRYTGDNVAVKQ